PCYHATLFSKTWRGRLAGLDKAGRRAAAHRFRQERSASGSEISRPPEGEAGFDRDQPVAAGIADGGDCCGRSKNEAAGRRSSRAGIWHERAADFVEAASLKGFDAGRPRTGFFKRDFRVNRRFPQGFQSRCGVGRYRSRDRERKTSLAVPAKIRAKK